MQLQVEKNKTHLFRTNLSFYYDEMLETNGIAIHPALDLTKQIAKRRQFSTSSLATGIPLGILISMPKQQVLVRCKETLEVKLGNLPIVSLHFKITRSQDQDTQNFCRISPVISSVLMFIRAAATFSVSPQTVGI